MPNPSTAPDAASSVTVTGRRATKGNGVDCPTIVDSAGTSHTVSYLPSTVAIGDTVTVSGFIAVSVNCNGPVLIVQKLTLAGG